MGINSNVNDAYSLFKQTSSITVGGIHEGTDLNKVLSQLKTTQNLIKY